MTVAEIKEVLGASDDDLYVDLLSDEEVEQIMKRRGGAMNCASVGFSTSLSGACCCQQVDSACGDGLTSPDSTCTNPLTSCA